MRTKSRLLSGTAIYSRAMAGAYLYLLGKKKPDPLYRRKDGTLTFSNGAAVRAKDLIPGKTYDVVIHPTEWELK